MLSALPFFLLSFAALPSMAQTGPPNCTDPALNWSFNSDGLSPCAITVALGGACANGQFRLPAISGGLVYLAPNSTNNTPCRCSSVYYSALSACSACQGADYLAWSTYNAACPAVFLRVFPEPIPPTIKVPNWAYLDVTPSDNFNLTAARAAGGPESSAVPSQPQTSAPSPTNSSNNPSSGGGVNAGAIAGGVIGGIAFLAIVAGGVFWFLRKQRLARERQNSSGYDDMSYAPSTFVTTTAPTPKPYDPNDPSTFPTSDNSYGTTPYASTPGPGSVAPNFTGSTLNTTPFTPARPHYTGAPEL